MSGANFEFQNYLTTSAAQELTSFSRTWLYTLMHRGKINAVKVGRDLFFEKDSLRAYLHSKKPVGGRGHKAS